LNILKTEETIMRDEREAALDRHENPSPDKIVVGIAAYPLMESPNAIGGLSISFTRRDGEVVTLILPREECAIVRGIVEELDNIDWQAADSLAIPSARMN
jgi:hypothetical protein